ncbi:DNA/RNA polymerases superfamily protein [Gossypium australe]|uniref:DNA/RNA polymerases superfamily protein n=1 Tax=Gossypium australe TaxID=47621 RepID=A0A5B6WH10_9ROSI|nr:DNA/RNA polymerases superfamily protein [Gossypium australe]
MYQDLKELYWRPRLKQDVTDFVSKLSISFLRGCCNQLEFRNGNGRESLGTLLKKLYEALGTRLDFKKAFHSHTDGQSKWVIQIFEDMLRGCVIEFRGTWAEHLSLIAPYTVLHDHKCRTLLCWTELGERKVLGLELVQETGDTIRLIWDRLKAYSDRKKSYADLRYLRGKKVLRFGRKGKLIPRYLRELDRQLISLSCHQNWIAFMIWYRSDPSHIIPIEEIEVRSDMSFEDEPMQILDRELKILR